MQKIHLEKYGSKSKEKEMTKYQDPDLIIFVSIAESFYYVNYGSSIIVSKAS